MSVTWSESDAFSMAQFHDGRLPAIGAAKIIPNQNGPGYTQAITSEQFTGITIFCAATIG